MVIEPKTSHVKEAEKERKKTRRIKGDSILVTAFAKKKKREMELREFDPSYCFREKEKGNGVKGIRSLLRILRNEEGKWC